MLGTLAAGTVFAGYTIDRLLGVGGLSAVYLARHPNLPRNVALKLLHLSTAVNEYARAHFEREAEIVAAFEHPNIVAVFDRGQEDDWLWIAMQFVDGVDAGRLIDADVVDLDRALHIVSESGRALDYAHRQGVLHRDVKPANILIAPPLDPQSRERVMISDFGIALAVEESARVTKTGDVVATLSFASPEQIRGEELDRRTDVYSLGCTFFNLITGQPPYSGPAHRVMFAQLNEPVPVPSQIRPGLPFALDVVLATAMAKDRNERYDTCQEFTAALASSLRGAPVELPPRAPAAPEATGAFPAPGLATGTAAYSATSQPLPKRAANPSGPPREPTRAFIASTPAPTPTPAAAPRRSRGLGRIALVLLAIAALAGVSVFAWTQLRGGSVFEGTPTELTVSEVSVFSPDGAPDHTSDAQNVIDGNSSTEWSTDQYFDNFPKFRQGMGLMLSLSEAAKLREVTINAPSGGAEVEIRLADSADADLADTTEVGSASLDSGDTTIEIDTSESAEYVLVWITSMPKKSGGYQAEIADIALKGL